MADVTQLLSAIEAGDPRAGEELLPLVYQELRRLAHARMASEPAGQTLQPTALVHEAYLRLVGSPDAPDEPAWNSRGHFFAAAAEAMRRILVERARRRASLKEGGGWQRIEIDDRVMACDERPEELIDLNEALSKLEEHDSQIAALVKLRYFAGLTHQESADALGITRRTADRLWTLARAWLRQEIS